ncbi:MAG: hypothetical protein ACTHJ8_08570 [Mucilaginibacter sp.]
MRNFFINFYTALQVKVPVYKYRILALGFIVLACITYATHHIVSAAVIFSLVMAVIWAALDFYSVEKK